MGFESYDRAPAALEERSVAQQQSSFINRVFGWMTVGLAVSGVIAYLVAQNADLLIKVARGVWVIVILELVVVVGLSAAINRLSPMAATVAGMGLYALFNRLLAK